MRTFYLAVLILYLSNHLSQCSVNDDFVDPLDMLNYDRATKSMKRPKTKSINEPMQINDRCTVFLFRFINILLKTTGLYDVDHASNVNIEELASVTISVKDLEVLKNIITKKDIDYEEIDRILNNMFSPSKNNFKWQQTNGFFETNIEIKAILYWTFLGCIVICLLSTIYHYFFHWFSISFVIFVVFILAFASTWYTMYMKAEISRMVHLDNMPTHCYKNTEGWFSSWFSNSRNLDECKKYKEAIHLNPKYSIAITEVLAEMFSKMMMKPLECMGEAIYGFNKSVFKDFPFWAQLILAPVVIIVIIKIMFISLALLVGKYVSMKSIFGYGSTTIGPEQTHCDRSTTNNKTYNPSCPTALGQNTFTQMPAVRNFNLEFNVCLPSSSNNAMDYRNKRIDNQYKFNFKNKESDFLSMLKNEHNDCVDNVSFNDLKVNKSRPRTFSI